MDTPLFICILLCQTRHGCHSFRHLEPPERKSVLPVAGLSHRFSPATRRRELRACRPAERPPAGHFFRGVSSQRGLDLAGFGAPTNSMPAKEPRRQMQRTGIVAFCWGIVRSNLAGSLIIGGI